ncbi:MAG: hypothetical protein ABI865_09605, partial [Nitrosospira sp.]
MTAQYERAYVFWLLKPRPHFTCPFLKGCVYFLKGRFFFSVRPWRLCSLHNEISLTYLREFLPFP